MTQFLNITSISHHRGILWIFIEWRARQVHLRWAGVDVVPLPIGKDVCLVWYQWYQVRLRPNPGGRHHSFSSLATTRFYDLHWRSCWQSKHETETASFRPGVEDQPVQVRCDRESSWLDSLWLTGCWWFCQHRPRSSDSTLSSQFFWYCHHAARNDIGSLRDDSTPVSFLNTILPFSWCYLPACTASDQVTLRTRAAEKNVQNPV